MNRETQAQAETIAQLRRATGCLPQLRDAQLDRFDARFPHPNALNRCGD